MVIVKRITNADSSYTYQMVFLAGFTINVTPFSGLLGVSSAVSGDWAEQLTGRCDVLIRHSKMCMITLEIYRTVIDILWFRKS